jgi:heme/copper-type cytochrome/quinol oxidase subunit 3
MESEYRNALEAAQRRIQQLEAEREPVRKPKKTSLLWFLFPAVAVFSMLLVPLGAVLLVWRAAPRPTYTESWPTESPPQAQPGAALP